MSWLLAVLFLLTGATGTGIALTRTPRRQVMAIGVNGLALALLFMALQAPDVAFAELAVGAVATPLLFLVAVASTRVARSPDEPDRQ